MSAAQQEWSCLQQVRLHCAWRAVWDGHIGAVVALVLYSFPDARAGAQAARSAACLTCKLA